MRNQESIPRKSRQHGTALMLAMIILIGITLLSLAGINTSILELRMARNTESVKNTFQVGLATIDYIVGNTDNLPTTGALYDEVPVTLPDDPDVAGEPFDLVAGETITATATRTQDCAPPPRARLAFSLASFSAFVYEARAAVDKNATGDGRTEMRQGYILLGPKC